MINAMSAPAYKRRKANGEAYAISVHAENLYLKLETIYTGSAVPSSKRHHITDPILQEALEMYKHIERAMYRKMRHKGDADKRINQLNKAQGHLKTLQALILINDRIIKRKNPESLANDISKLVDSFSITVRNVYRAKAALPTEEQYIESRKASAKRRDALQKIRKNWKIEDDRDDSGMYVLKKQPRDADGFIVLLKTPEFFKKMQQHNIEKDYAAVGDAKRKKRDKRKKGYYSAPKTAKT